VVEDKNNKTSLSHDEPITRDCCATDSKNENEKTQDSESCHPPRQKIDLLFWGSTLIGLFFYFGHFFAADLFAPLPGLATTVQTTFDLINTMWFSMLLGILVVGFLTKIPQNMVLSILGTGGTIGSLGRAVSAGILLDLCSHGILMVGAKLYHKGASIGQVVAFLVASPWNSFSLTLIMIVLMGWGWTLAFILLSAVIAITAGYMFDMLVRKGVLPENPNKSELPTDYHFWSEAKKGLKATKFDFAFFKSSIVDGFGDSRMVLRWIFFGVILASFVRGFVSTDTFQTYFGPSLMGLAMTIGVATIIEVCSEGSTPIAADLLTRAKAPGNSFAFLMTGVATDYTEIMVLKETTRSWKIALFLPLLTVPQVLVISYVMNGLGG
jgi:hypothetical protein